jgi:hypothetical protein
VDEAAAKLVAGLAPEELLDFDGRVQNQIRRQFRAVVNYCLESSGQAGPLRDLLTKEAEDFLAARLGDAGPAEVFAHHFGADAQAAQRAVAQAYDEAEPELSTARAAKGVELSILAAPATPAGDQFRALAEETLTGETLRPAGSGDDLVFYRELHGLTPADLPQLGPQARDAYQALLDTDRPPHARRDVAWQPPGR